MGRLSSTELEYLAAGGPIKMDWAVIQPTDQYHTAYSTYIFDQGIYPTGGTDNYHRVTRPGSRGRRPPE